MGCICNKTHNEDDDHGVDYVALGQYIGEKNCCGQRHGKGQYYYDNGDSYDGTWKRNMKHGYGTYTYADGRRYQINRLLLECWICSISFM